MEKLNRRKFIASAAIITAGMPIVGFASSLGSGTKNDFTFALLGDLHFDKFDHHDVKYMKEYYPNDIRQVINYARITWENMPELMKVLKAVSDKNDVDFILQVGDFLEGLCGSKELAAMQANDFIKFVDDQKFQKPFIVTKGNHDITGTGAKEVYVETVLPWQQKELKKQVSSANFSFVHNNSRFVIFDGYAGPESLDWFKKVLDTHKEERLFFSVHEPIVPYNARSSWHVFNRNPERRQELINLLGRHNAIVLGGHLHKTSIVVRRTDHGNFVQVAIGSVIPALDAKIKDHLKGVEKYTSNLVDLEPEFSPSTLQQRKDILQKEAAHIRYFEYADFCGYGLISIKNKDVVLSVFANVDQKPWTTVNLSKLLKS